MKTKKIVIGAMAATMLSLSICSLIPAAAAGETVQISVSDAKAEAGGTFTVEVSMADIPKTGIQACNFALEFDSKVVSIDTITAGKLAQTGADGKDPSASMLDNFNKFTDNSKGYVSLMWSTSLEDASYWLTGEGVFCTVTGTIAAGATGSTKINVVPTIRETSAGSGVMNDEIDCGYLKDGEKVSYAVTAKSGTITIGKGGDTPSGKYLRGDANCDGEVSIADATAILQHIGNPDVYGLSKQGIENGDLVEPAGITGTDALRIQQYDAKLISADEL